MKRSKEDVQKILEAVERAMTGQSDAIISYHGPLQDQMIYLKPCSVRKTASFVTFLEKGF